MIRLLFELANFHKLWFLGRFFVSLKRPNFRHVWIRAALLGILGMNVKTGTLSVHLGTPNHLLSSRHDGFHSWQCINDNYSAHRKQHIFQSFRFYVYKLYMCVYIIICIRTCYTFRLLWGFTCVAWTHSFWEVVLAPKGEGERNDANMKTDYCKLEKLLQFSCNEAIISARKWKFPWTTAQYSEETVLTAARLHAQSASDNQH